MRFGVALPECVLPSYDATLRALDAFAERSRMPDVVPLWSREWQVDARLVAAIRERGAEVVLYVETLEPVIPVDELLRFADAVGDGTAVRINQEPEGSWDASWQSWGAPLYVAHWSGCRFILRSRADIRVWWCPSRPARAVQAGYWPGEADIVGFDRYQTKDDHWPQEQFEGLVRQCQAIAPGVPVWVGETGSLAGLSRRAERLRQLEHVEADVVVVMNLPAERPDGGVDDWTWVPPQDRAFKGMMAT